MNTNIIYNEDCIKGMKRIPCESVDVICTDPPYKYLKNQKLETEFDEEAFFTEAVRVLKPKGFVVCFGRGSSFYRWNTIMEDKGMKFKEEIVWDKVYTSSPLSPVVRNHETISIHTKKDGTIKKSKIPYLEKRKYEPEKIISDIKKISVILNNPKELDKVKKYIETDNIEYTE